MEITTDSRLFTLEKIELLLNDIKILEQSINREKNDALSFKNSGLPELERQCYNRMNKKSREIIELNLKIENLKNLI